MKPRFKLTEANGLSYKTGFYSPDDTVRSGPQLR
jgi:hypothetical protein